MQEIWICNKATAVDSDLDPRPTSEDDFDGVDMQRSKVNERKSYCRLIESTERGEINYTHPQSDCLSF